MQPSYSCWGHTIQCIWLLPKQASSSVNQTVWYLMKLPLVLRTWCQVLVQVPALFFIRDGGRGLGPGIYMTSFFSVCLHMYNGYMEVRVSVGWLDETWSALCDSLLQPPPSLLPSVSIFLSYGGWITAGMQWVKGGWKGIGREVAALHTLHTLCSKLHDYEDRPPWNNSIHDKT